MKILFEASVQPKDYKRSQFNWLNNGRNWLFIIEDGKRLRTISISDDPGKELQSATLTEAKTCTYLCWNKDATLLALVIDKRQVYLWETKNNQFTHFKSTSNYYKSSSFNNNVIAKRSKGRDIELMAWSKVTNKLVMAYSSGQLLLCNFVHSNTFERFIDNSEGVLKPITAIESSAHLDVFVCLTIISEVLIMSFDGDSKFYIQGEDSCIERAKFSMPFPEHSSRPGYRSDRSHEQGMWLACQSANDKLFFSKIILNKHNQITVNTEPRASFVYNEGVDSKLVEFYWLSSSHLITCFASGAIKLVELKGVGRNQRAGSNSKVVSKLILDLQQEDEPYKTTNEGEEMKSPKMATTKGEIFNSFKLMGHEDEHEDSLENNVNKSSISLAAMTPHRLFYYELFEGDLKSRYSIEKVDDLDLTESLLRIGLELERVEWCFDSSMLAVQLTNGHILIYQTRLQDYKVTSYGPKTAYLSGQDEVTVLNYGPDVNSGSKSLTEQGSEDSSADCNNASTINVGLKPSVIAIGSKHLAVALNNRVRFYDLQTSTLNQANELPCTGEHEYVSIVVAIRLCSRFVAVQFDDGRLKLHAIHTIFRNEKSAILHRLETVYDDLVDFDTNERFFPDPTKRETIVCFTLTETLFVYSTLECHLNVFSLKDWIIIQNLDHSEQFEGSILHLRPNEHGNKIICITKDLPQKTLMISGDDGPNDYLVNAYLYDLFSNCIIRCSGNDLYKKIFKSQLKLNLAETSSIEVPEVSNQQRQVFKPIQIIDAIWDRDGRNVLLIDQRNIYNCIVLDHTLEREVALFEIVSQIGKASSYTALYASHGIVSFQTRLGRVVNSISESHDDELKLSKLKHQILALRETTLRNGNLLAGQAKVMGLKLSYLRTVMPIYSLSKSKEICEYLASDEQFNFEPKSRCREIDLVLWKQLAAWALFSMDLDLALLIYRKHRLLMNAHTLSDIIKDTRKGGGDARPSIKARLLVLLGCVDGVEE